MIKFLYIFLLSFFTFAQEEVYFPMDSGEFLRVSKAGEGVNEYIDFKIIKFDIKKEVVTDEFKLSKSDLDHFLEENIAFDEAKKATAYSVLAYSIGSSFLALYAMYGKVGDSTPEKLKNIIFWSREKYNIFREKIIKFSKVDKLEDSCKKHLLMYLPEILWFAPSVIKSTISINTLISVGVRDREYQSLRKMAENSLVLKHNQKLKKELVLTLKNLN